MDDGLEPLRSHEKNCGDFHSRIYQARCRASEFYKGELSRGLMQGSNVRASPCMYPQQMPSSQSFRTIFYTHLTAFTPLVHVHSEQMPSAKTASILALHLAPHPPHADVGENSIDLDLPTLNANRRGSMPCESHAQY
jgi:hypothetical protein